MSYPRNPVSGRNNRPRENGQTRIRNGRLEYLNPMSVRWEPAVRLESIRGDILRSANPKQYKYPKSNGNKHKREPYNYTSFLAKDRNVGSERAHRPDILFQIRTPELHAVKPNGYVMWNGCIILDPFDHGLRNFPELPVVLSSELGGCDIEYYYRQNAEIADYDLIARMPNGYFTGRAGSRRHEGPPRVGTINQRAQRFRIKAACITWSKREGTGSKNGMILGMIPKECIAANSTKGWRDLTRAEFDLIEKKHKGRAKKRGNTGGDFSDDGEGDGDDGGDDAPSQTDDEWTLTSVRRPYESVEHGRDRPHPTTSSRTLPGQSSLLANPPTTIASQAMPSRMTLRSNRAIAPPAPSMHEDSGASVDDRLPTPVRRTTIHREFGTKSLPPNTSADASLPEHDEPESSATGRKRRHQTEDEAGSDDEELLRRSGPNITETPYLNYYIARRAGNFAGPDPNPAHMAAEELKRHNAWTMSDLQKRRQKARQPCLPWDPDMDEEFQTETLEGIAAGDYRYMAPQDHGSNEEDINAVSRALLLTKIQYSSLKGHCVPGDFREYAGESYASQWRRIQDNFESVWTVFSKPRKLYRLTKWGRSFSNWKVKKDDALGRALLAKLDEGDRALANMEREWAEEDRLEAEEAARKEMEMEWEGEEEDEEEE